MPRTSFRAKLDDMTVRVGDDETKVHAKHGQVLIVGVSLRVQ